ncbi:MAG: ornithine carbamoyltransferase [Candidatus Aenigmarchaeota archaeon]|nr:ornithine carbamoyltransferase [Candidatus Aenigmarchaeota archaeon]
MKHLISISDLTKNDVTQIFKTTDKLKNKKMPLLKDKILAMVFEKPSTRTRVSFEVAMEHLGGHAINLSHGETQLVRDESIADTAKVLSRYVDAIMARVFEHKTLMELAKYASVPVINGLSHKEHPCQALADAYTILKRKGLKGKIVFLGDGTNNTFNSLVKVCGMFGMDIIVSCPAGYKPKIKGKYKVVESPKEAVKDADVLYTDTFVSMGEEKEIKKRIADLKGYQLNSSLVKTANNPIVMHPLPAHRSVEITSDVMDGKNSVVFEQAENRLHVQKAILYLLLK